MRKPGHPQGVRRHQRYGQQTLNVGATLDSRYVLSVGSEMVEVLTDEGPVLIQDGPCRYSPRAHLALPARAVALRLRELKFSRFRSAKAPKQKGRPHGHG